MVDLISATPTLLATAAAQAEKTERSPLLYAWWALNLAVLFAVGYGVYRLVKSWRAERRPRG
ncbi:hypothetical protein [Streptomyces sp. UNOB3_S3]|uniref:hypothetical protein n=1 Tax=Streptomyces sp. UNOB3_S3 TaxID=2871682 RepID=UPI001E312A3A|nr:hypothetical protein [Streptomyces sp. UNOB3_S3]MCC3773719.1 hypothetical protein [Streptomyces sp. UNOB3_S3]